MSSMRGMQIRPAFSNQNGQCLIIDIGDISLQYLSNIIRAVSDVLSLACSVRGGVRIPAFSLSVLSKGVTDLYEFDTIRGNFNKITAALNMVSAYCEINAIFELQEFKDSLYLAINSLLNLYTAKQGKNDWINNISQLEITFISMKDCQILKSNIEELIQNLEVSKICKIVIIELQYMEHEIIENKNGLVHTVVMNGANHLQLQRHFKTWLIDQCTEIDAILHFPNEANLSLKCDIFECVINPLSLPFGHRIYLQMDSLSVQMTGVSVTSSAALNIPVYEMNILARVSSDAICESTLFGLPLCLRPSRSWRLSVEEEQSNLEYFSELCKQLSECEQFLLAQMRSHFQTDHFCPLFVLTPGDCCLLMKSFASSDITLPWKQETITIETSTENSLKVLSAMQKLELISNLDSNAYECGLFSALKANLKHARRSNNTDDHSLPSKRSKYLV